MKKFIALILCLVLVAALFVGCSDSKTPAETKANEGTNAPAAETKNIKVGLICIGDENDQGYTYNFIRGRDAATEALKAKGINVEWVTKWNIGEDSSLPPSTPTSNLSPVPTRPPGATSWPTPTTPLPPSMRAVIWPVWWPA